MEPLLDTININIHTSCRTCLGNITKDCHNIFNIPDLEKKFTVCTSLPVAQDDGYPTSLCDSCLNKINDFYNFQQMSISSWKRFQEYNNSEEKLCKSDLNVEFKNASQGITSITEPKEEREDNSLSNDDQSSDFGANVKCREVSSSEEHTEESDDDQPIVKYRTRNETISKKDSTLIINTEDSTRTELKLSCEICKKTFKTQETFEEHMHNHKGKKPFACQQCDKSYARPDRLRAHVKVKHERKLFPCTEPQCGKTMCSEQTLQQHIAEVHPNTNGSNANKTKQLYICEECGKVLKGLSTLKNHRFLHSGQPRPHACPQCHKRYMTRCKLKDHMNRHAGIKNFVCPHCGAKKSSRSELKNHVNYHTKEKTYPCHICNMVFNNIVNYSRHRRVVHEGIKNFPCSYCDKSFGKSETRKHHEMIHTGEKPHECNICHKKFIQIVSLKKHQKVHLKASGNG